MEHAARRAGGQGARAVRRLTAAARAVAAAAAILVASGCASSQSPPGGPPDALPPEIESTSPDSASTGVRPDRVIFDLNEVVSERPQGAATLTALFLVSPRDGEPRVEWKRDRILVRPRRSWRPNTVYTVTMLPGLTDLRGNVRREGSTLVFSTGPTIPNTVLSGTVWDWPAGRTGARALVQAITAEDTTISYVTVADSSGRFALPHLPPGRYVVRGVLDQNNNRVLDRREAYDSTLVTFADTSTLELLAFVHDTIGPRIQTATVRDSLTLRVTFDKPIDVAQTIDASLFTLKAADSSLVPIALAAPAARFDSLERERQRASADSAARARQAVDTTAQRDTGRRAQTPPRRDAGVAGQRVIAAPPGRNPQGVEPSGPPRPDSAARDTSSLPRPSRPSPITEVVVVLRSPLAAGASYRLQSVNVRNLLGVPRTSDRVITTPKPAPADSSAVPGAAGARPDTGQRRAPRPTPPR